jgi:hypothetical protein
MTATGLEPPTFQNSQPVDFTDLPDRTWIYFTDLFHGFHGKSCRPSSDRTVVHVWWPSTRACAGWGKGGGSSPRCGPVGGRGGSVVIGRYRY